MSCHHKVIKRYRKGAEAKTNPAINKNFLLPKMSESEAAGKLIKMPGMVEAAAITPVQSVGVPLKLGSWTSLSLGLQKNP